MYKIPTSEWFVVLMNIIITMSHDVDSTLRIEHEFKQMNDFPITCNYLEEKPLMSLAREYSFCNELSCAITTAYLWRKKYSYYELNCTKFNITYPELNGQNEIELNEVEFCQNCTEKHRGRFDPSEPKNEHEEWLHCVTINRPNFPYLALWNKSRWCLRFISNSKPTESNHIDVQLHKWIVAICAVSVSFMTVICVLACYSIRRRKRILGKDPAVMIGVMSKPRNSIAMVRNIMQRTTKHDRELLKETERNHPVVYVDAITYKGTAPLMNHYTNVFDYSSEFPQTLLIAENILHAQSFEHAYTDGDDPEYATPYEISVDKRWNLAQDDFALLTVLSKGTFGKVCKARYFGAKSEIPPIVTVKMCKDNHCIDDVLSLSYEYEVLSSVGTHPNILKLFGAWSKAGSLHIVMEFAERGNLRDFLSARRPISENLDATRESNFGEVLVNWHLVNYAHQIATGLEYLNSRGCLHRDLATRNVLVTDTYVMKITGFGLARDIGTSEYYRKTKDGLLPLKWLSLESLTKGIYTTKSDVWSFGILLWELMTYASEPYSEITSKAELFSRLVSGYRMEHPENCSTEIYYLMRTCWIEEPAERPSFSEIVCKLNELSTKQ